MPIQSYRGKPWGRGSTSPPLLGIRRVKGNLRNCIHKNLRPNFLNKTVVKAIIRNSTKEQGKLMPAKGGDSLKVEYYYMSPSQISHLCTSITRHLFETGVKMSAGISKEHYVDDPSA